MRESDEGTFVPYADFVARRHRRLRVTAELRSQAAAQTIEHEEDQRESPAVSTPIDDRRTPQHEERHRDVFRQSMRLIHRTDS